jgi:hypothetical protein
VITKATAGGGGKGMRIVRGRVGPALSSVPAHRCTGASICQWYDRTDAAVFGGSGRGKPEIFKKKQKNG